MTGIPDVDHRPVKLNMAARTDPGQTRSENQDSFLVLSMPSSEADPPRMLHSRDPERSRGGAAELALQVELGPRGMLLVVADGMGGAAAGATASREAVLRVADRVLSGWGREKERTPRSFARHLREAVTGANTHLWEMSRSRPEFDGMGTTLTAAGFLDDFLYLAQIGDSRGYLAREEEMTQITRDQSMVQQMLESGAISEDQARTSNQRHVLMQALGVEERVEVDLTWQQLRAGDLVLLCSDGLTGVLEDSELARATRRHTDPGELCRVLVDQANDRGGPDNITVMAARMDGAGLRRPGPADEPVGRRTFPRDEA